MIVEDRIDVPMDELVSYRRHLHANPELSFQEFETAALVERELRSSGFDDASLRTQVATTGILATLRGGRPGPTTLLRADMDALPMEELAESPYRSKRPGAMHACGHDGHVAILLSAAKALAARRAEVPGTLVFCFQPAEEGYAGAQVMIEEGALENPHVDRCFSLHLYSGLDVGSVGIRDGAFFASSDRFTLKIRGKGGHGAMPELSIDPIVGAAQLVGALQTIVSREIAASDAVVVTVAKFDSGTTFNVIPESATLLGTVRTLDPAIRETMPARMERIIAGLCAAMRLEYSFEYHWGYPITYNDPATNDAVRSVARRMLGSEAICDPHQVGLWGEDMAFMHEERPGAYFLVGVRGPEKGREPQHSSRYDIDERGLGVGFQMMVGLGLFD
ncbi:MAG TPA: amidohydrolase [Candidatus Dormibacteraeota bacterium]|nr:amidohydrolase [Candidatus Dormibacteraeota bacterium]